jgi:hypothetical protein
MDAALSQHNRLGVFYRSSLDGMLRIEVPDLCKRWESGTLM